MSTRKSLKTVNLALQGGGAHGAFTWGVLDALLEDGQLRFEGVCACSAGTMNALALAYGLHLGDNETAREKLEQFWYAIHRSGRLFNPVQRMPWERNGDWNMDQSLSFFMLDSMTRLFSPYQLNPLDINPLKDVLLEQIDFDALRQCTALKLFISATHVKTGKVRVFDNAQVSIEAALASACLPFLFKAVEVEGEHYWDGGYMGNPSLFPLFYKTETRDILLVHVNPIERDEVPTQAASIMNRLNEITFNNSLLKDMRAIALVKKLLENDMLNEKYRAQYKDVLLHSVRADEAMCDLGVSSKLDTDWHFLTQLRDKGREAAQAWLDQHRADIGVRDTVDLHGEFLNTVTDMFEAT